MHIVVGIISLACGFRKPRAALVPAQRQPEYMRNVMSRPSHWDGGARMAPYVPTTAVESRDAWTVAPLCDRGRDTLDE